MTSQRAITILISLLLIVGVVLGGCTTGTIQTTDTEYLKATAVKQAVWRGMDLPLAEGLALENRLGKQLKLVK